MVANRFLACWALVCAVGCGSSSSDSDGSKKVVTGLPPDKPLSEVTDAEAEQACLATAEVFADQFSEAKQAELICTIVGLATAQTPSICRAYRDICIDSPPEDIGLPFGPNCSGANAASLEACSATVSDWENCNNDIISERHALLGLISCELAGNEQAVQDPRILSAAQLPQSCQTLQAECPDVEF